MPRSFTDEELMALAMPEGVGRVVLIQHYPHHGYDNSYLIDTWKKLRTDFGSWGKSIPVALTLIRRCAKKCCRQA